MSKEQKEKEEKDLMEAKVAVSRKHRRKEEKEIEEQKEEDEDNEGKDDEEEEGEGGATEREQKEEIDDHIGQEDIDLQEVAVVSAGEESLVQVFTESRAVSKEVGGENSHQMCQHVPKTSFFTFRTHQASGCEK